MDSDWSGRRRAWLWLADTLRQVASQGCGKSFALDAAALIDRMFSSSRNPFAPDDEKQVAKGQTSGRRVHVIVINK
jgi:hypothetical protein